MSKHHGPWRYDERLRFVRDGNGSMLARMETDDPEARAVLIHAAEMWEALRDFEETPVDTQEWVALEIRIRKLTAKIESEIANAKDAR